MHAERAYANLMVKLSEPTIVKPATFDLAVGAVVRLIAWVFAGWATYAAFGHWRSDAEGTGKFALLLMLVIGIVVTGEGIARLLPDLARELNG